MPVVDDVTPDTLRDATAHFVLAALLFGLAGCTAPKDGLVITNAYIREPVAGRTVATGYFDIENRGTPTRRLEGARTSVAKRVEIHTHVHDGDMMRMRQVEGVALEPGKLVSFAPGGLHLMLFGVASLTADDVEVLLVFDGGAEERVRFTVRRTDGGSTR